jgi:hypothetical protein
MKLLFDENFVARKASTKGTIVREGTLSLGQISKVASC